MHRRRRRKSQVSAFLSRVLAAVLLFGLALVDGLHALQGMPWPGFDVRANWIAALIIPVLVVGACAALLPRRRAWWVTAAAASIALVHGLNLRMGDSRAGYAYVGVGLLTLALLGIALVALSSTWRRTHAHHALLVATPTPTPAPT